MIYSRDLFLYSGGSWSNQRGERIASLSAAVAPKSARLAVWKRRWTWSREIRTNRNLQAWRECTRMFWSLTVSEPPASKMEVCCCINCPPHHLFHWMYRPCFLYPLIQTRISKTEGGDKAVAGCAADLADTPCQRVNPHILCNLHEPQQCWVLCTWCCQI